jgi:predicted amidohydrolase
VLPTASGEEEAVLNVAGGDAFPAFRAAAVQAASVFLDRRATLDKVESLVAEAARGGAQLVVFSESFVPSFPVWNLVLAPLDQHPFFRALYEQAILVPSAHTERLAGIARRDGVHLSVGITERSPISMGALYNTNLLFGPTGELLNRHRKLVPTWAEKLSWAPGDGSQLRPVETELGRIGTLICGENTNTLARYALLAQGEQVHIATYPPAWPTRRPGAAGNYDLTRAIEIRSGAHSFEGKLFSVVAAGVLDRAAVTAIARVDPRAEEALVQAPPPVSMILNPAGEPCSERLVGEEGIVYGEIDVADSIEAKQMHDIVGSYQRFDVFSFAVDQRPQRPVRLVGDPLEGPGAHDDPDAAAHTDASA